MLRYSMITLARSALCCLAFNLSACVINTEQPANEAIREENQAYLSLQQLRDEYGKPESRYMTIQGMEIHFMDEGEGPALLMVHGSLSSLHTWDIITDKLKRDFRVIRYDIPGYGLSGPALEPAVGSVAPEAIAAELLQRLGVSSVTAVGTSSGGTLATFLAAQYPTLVQRLVLCNMPSSPLSYDHLVMPQSFLDAQQRVKQQDGFRDPDFWYQYHSYFAGDPLRISAQVLKEYYDYGRREPEAYPIGMVAVIGDGVAAAEKMSRVTQPTLLVWGSSDPLLPRSAAENLENMLPQADVSRVFLDDVGHYPPLESGERVGALIDAYLKTAIPQ